MHLVFGKIFTAIGLLNVSSLDGYSDPSAVDVVCGYGREYGLGIVKHMECANTWGRE